MLQQIAGRHTGEFMRALRNGHFEVTPSGFFFPRQKAILGGAMSIGHCKGPWDIEQAMFGPMDSNLIVAQGREYEQGVALLGGAASTHWYVAPYAANIAPDDNLTATNFTTVLTEFVNYTETTRQEWIKNGASVEGSASNSTSPAVITIGSAAADAVYGGGLLSVSAKSSGSGILYAAVLATKPKTNLDENDTLGFIYNIDLTST